MHIRTVRLQYPYRCLERVAYFSVWSYWSSSISKLTKQTTFDHVSVCQEQWQGLHDVFFVLGVPANYH